MRHVRFLAPCSLVLAIAACGGERVPPVPEPVDVSITGNVPSNQPLTTADSATADTTPVTTALVGEFRAAGNEPFWSVLINAEAITLKTPQELTGVAFPAKLAEVRGNRFHWAAETAQPNRHTIDISITEEPCHDTMADKTWTHRAVIVYDGKELVGCAEGGRTPGTSTSQRPR